MITRYKYALGSMIVTLFVFVIFIGEAIILISLVDHFGPLMTLTILGAITLVIVGICGFWVGVNEEKGK